MRQKGPRWTVASARQSFPTLLGLAAREPQEVYRRQTLVARVIGPDEPVRTRKPMAEALAELQQICKDERYTLEAPRRADRPNPFSTRRVSKARNQRKRRRT